MAATEFGDLTRLDAGPGDVFVLTLPDGATAQDAFHAGRVVKPKLNGAELVILSSGANLRRASPYYVREICGDYTREVNFATLAEMEAYLAGVDRKKAEAPPAGGYIVPGGPIGDKLVAAMRAEGMLDGAQLDRYDNPLDPPAATAGAGAAPEVKFTGEGKNIQAVREGYKLAWVPDGAANALLPACPAGHHADGRTCRLDCACRCGYCEGNRS